MISLNVIEQADNYRKNGIKSGGGGKTLLQVAGAMATRLKEKYHLVDLHFEPAWVASAKSAAGKRPQVFFQCNYLSQLAIMLYASWRANIGIAYKNLAFVADPEGNYLVLRGTGLLLHQNLDVRQLIKQAGRLTQPAGIEKTGFAGNQKTRIRGMRRRTETQNSAFQN